MNLPIEIVLHIVSFLPLRDKLVMRCVCKDFLYEVEHAYPLNHIRGYMKYCCENHNEKLLEMILNRIRKVSWKRVLYTATYYNNRKIMDLALPHISKREVLKALVNHTSSRSTFEYLCYLLNKILLCVWLSNTLECVVRRGIHTKFFSYLLDRYYREKDIKYPDLSLIYLVAKHGNREMISIIVSTSNDPRRVKGNLLCYCKNNDKMYIMGICPMKYALDKIKSIRPYIVDV